MKFVLVDDFFLPRKINTFFSVSSANILEIPLSNDTEKVPNKVVNSHSTEGNGTSPNNKNKTIVRKNNIVMEVTWCICIGLGTRVYTGNWGRVATSIILFITQFLIFWLLFCWRNGERVQSSPSMFLVANVRLLYVNQKRWIPL